jgi:hypothetical protein
MKAGRLFLGMLAGNVLGAAICGIAVGIGRLFAASPSAVIAAAAYPSLLLVPFAIGLGAGWVWRPLNLRRVETVLHSLLCTVIGLAGAWTFFGVGTICLVIVSPLLFVGVLAGATVGRLWPSGRNGTRNLCLAPLAILVVAAEPMVSSPRSGVVVDEVRIAAPPSRVWPHVLAFSEIPDPPDYWLFKLGLPYPTSTTNGGDFVGAARACKFSGGLVFEEMIAEFEPERLLTFDITKAPADPELLGHLDTQRGQFELRDNHDGTTTLIGRSWYALHVRPAWYFDWWTQDICRAVHLRVMEHVKRLAEG